MVRHAEKPSGKIAPMWHASWTLQVGPTGQNAHKIVNGVNCDITFAKWGKMDEILLNEVISVKNVKIGGKNRNSLYIYGFVRLASTCSYLLLYHCFLLYTVATGPTFARNIYSTPSVPYYLSLI